MKVKSRSRIRRNRPPNRNLISFDPSTPIREMLEAEVRAEENRGHRHVRTRIIERCIADQLGDRHPELAQRYQIINDERWPRRLLIENQQAA
jgi:hypothetical protein